jgi:hypothetical protein
MFLVSPCHVTLLCQVFSAASDIEDACLVATRTGWPQMTKCEMLALLAAVAMVSGCASVEFYKDPALQGPKTGLKYYNSKPYVFVSRTGANDKPVEPQIVFLPDLDDPTYAKFVPGIGSHNFSVGLSNGTLTSYGQSGDTKVGEILTGLAGLVTARGELSKALAEAEKTRAEAREVQAKVSKPKTAVADSVIDDWVKRLRNIAFDLNNILLEATDRSFLTTNATVARDAIVQTLNEEATKLPGQNAPSKLRAVGERLDTRGVAAVDAIKINAPARDPIGQQLVEKLKDLRMQLNAVVSEIFANDPLPALGEFDLYEIRIKDGVTILIPVMMTR